MRKRFSLVCLLMAAVVAAPASLNAASVADFIDYSLRNASNQVLLPGRLYVPPAASDLTTPRPFILFLHGGGEVGTNNTSQINVNIDNLLAEAKQAGAFLYAPQSTTNWNSLTLTNNVMTMVGRAKTDLNVDARRLYVTGLSNGGGGTWNMLSRFPGQFAAGLPISGVSPAPDFVPARLVNEPIWAFHARDDSVVSVAASRTVLNSILSAAHETLPSYPPAGSTTDFFLSNPNLNIHRVLENLVNQQGSVSKFHVSGDQLDLLYYELSAGGHVIWPEVYGAPPVYGWLFSHALPVPEPGVAVAAAPTILFLFSLRRRRPNLLPQTKTKSLVLVAES
jgi:predicted peptidase